MILNRNFDIDSAATEATAFTIIGENPNGLSIAIHNLSDSNYIDYRFQDANSNTDSSFDNLSEGSGNWGVSGILSPDSVAMINIRSSKPFIRLLTSSSGGAVAEIGLMQVSNSASKNFTTGIL